VVEAAMKDYVESYPAEGLSGEAARD